MPRHAPTKFSANIFHNHKGRDRILPEYHTTSYTNKAGIPIVSCFVPAEAGIFFKCRFAYNGPAASSYPFSGLFERDGEEIAHAAVMDPIQVAGEIRGWRDEKRGQTWFMQFRSFVATGEDSKKASFKVPRKVGVLKLIIRRYDPAELEAHNKTTPFNVKIPPKYEECEGQWIKKEVEPPVADDYHDLFDHWEDPKPRQTHTAELVSEDGKVWRAPWRKLSDLGKPKELPADTKDNSIVVIFKFYYSSIEYIKTYTSLKDAIARRPLRRSGSKANVVVDPLRSSDDEHEDDPLFLRAARLSEVPEDSKRAEQRKIWLEMEARQRAEREALSARIRARLGYVEGDREFPLEIADDSDSD